MALVGGHDVKASISQHNRHSSAWPVKPPALPPPTRAPALPLMPLLHSLTAARHTNSMTREWGVHQARPAPPSHALAAPELLLFLGQALAERKLGVVAGAPPLGHLVLLVAAHQRLHVLRTPAQAGGGGDHDGTKPQPWGLVYRGAPHPPAAGPQACGAQQCLPWQQSGRPAVHPPLCTWGGARVSRADAWCAMQACSVWLLEGPVCRPVPIREA